MQFNIFLYYFCLLIKINYLIVYLFFFKLACITALIIIEFIDKTLYCWKVGIDGAIVEVFYF
jgi:hypothetical protein